MIKKIRSNVHVYNIVIASLLLLALFISTFAYWKNKEADINIPTYSFNATEDEFTYFACIPNLTSSTGYSYYDIKNIPSDLVDNIVGLAVVRFEALTKTAYIPSYPKVVINGIKYNYNEKQELPVIHILNSLQLDQVKIENGFENIETLVIPSTVTFIQNGAFSSSSNLKEVSILGSDDSGYLKYNTNEFNNVTPKWQNQSRKKDLFSISNQIDFKYLQFKDSLEYDNKNKTYYTYLVPKLNIDSISINDVIYNLDESLQANTKYKIEINNNNQISVSKYSYQLIIDNITTYNLTLNEMVEYEEYYIKNNIFNIIEIDNYPLIEVKEIISNGDSTKEKIDSKFNLIYLNANYTEDNHNYEIKYSPSYLYQSTHYYSESNGKLNDIDTITQLSVEKAYFLNTVTEKERTIYGEEQLTINVEDNNYLSLYVKGIYDDGTVYLNPSNNSEYIKMNLTNGIYSYQFKKSLAPEGKNSNPTQFIFYQGKYQVNMFPSYVSTYEDELTLQNHLENDSTTTRLILDLSNTNNQFFNDDHSTTENSNATFKWYLVYWKDQNDTILQYTKPIFYADSNSKLILVDVPNDADRFKFARIPCNSKIEDCLKNNWSGVTNQIEKDITFDMLGTNNTIKLRDFYNDNSGKFTFDLEINQDIKLLNQNRNYLIVKNYGEVGKTKFISLDENLAYNQKTISGANFSYEFFKLKDQNSRVIQSISLPKGSIFSTKLFNIFTNEYEVNTLGLNQDSSNFTTNTSINYFKKVDNEILVEDDCTLEIYLSVNYDSNGNITDWKYYFNIISNTLEEFNRSIIVDNNNEIEQINRLDDIIEKIDAYTYTYLEQSQDPILLTRNYSNKEFEEYYYQDFELLNGNYVVSTYYDKNVNLGGNNQFIGTINEDSSMGVFAINNQNLITFTPNNLASYEEKNYGIFDEYGNLLNTLSYNQVESRKNNYQTFVSSIPYALNEYKQIFIYEIDKNGNIIDENKVLYESNITNLDSSLANQVVNSEINFELYLDQINNHNAFVNYEENSSDLYYFGKYYNLNDLYIYNLQKEIISFSNNNTQYKLDFDIIDGYYYNQLVINSDNSIKLPQQGYYDLIVKKQNNYYYLGYKYLGENLSYQEPYYLEIYQNEVLIERIKMNNTSNQRNLFADFHISTISTLKIFNSSNTLIKTIELTNQEIKTNDNILYRLYYYNGGYKLSALKELGLNFNFDQDSPNLTLSDNIYPTNKDPFYNLLNSSYSDNYYIKSDEINQQMSKYKNLYSCYIYVKNFDQKFELYQNNNLLNNSFVISYPGSYLITYDGTNINISKVESPNIYYVYLDGKIISSLIVNNECSNYYEYVVNEYIVLNEEVNLNNNSLQIVDENMQVITDIETFTLNDKESTTLSKGVYQLYFSIDSSRRENNNYIVFTYLKFETKDKATINYHLNDESIISTIVDTTRLNQLIGYSSLSNYSPVGQTFDGWAISINGLKQYEDKDIISMLNKDQIIDLYPIFKDVEHQLIKLSDFSFDSYNDIIFTLSNLVDETIIDISYEYTLPEGFNGNDYITIENNVITIKPTLNELIGYQEGGQSFIIKIQKGNDKNSIINVEIKIDYPNYQLVNEDTI